MLFVTGRISLTPSLPHLVAVPNRLLDLCPNRTGCEFTHACDSAATYDFKNNNCTFRQVHYELSPRPFWFHANKARIHVPMVWHLLLTQPSVHLPFVPSVSYHPRSYVLFFFVLRCLQSLSRCRPYWVVQDLATYPTRLRAPRPALDPGSNPTINTNPFLYLLLQPTNLPRYLPFRRRWTARHARGRCQ
jgi:hypothetical protein